MRVSNAALYAREMVDNAQLKVVNSEKEVSISSNLPNFTKARTLKDSEQNSVCHEVEFLIKISCSMQDKHVFLLCFESKQAGFEISLERSPLIDYRPSQFQNSTEPSDFRVKFRGAICVLVDQHEVILDQKTQLECSFVFISYPSVSLTVNYNITRYTDLYLDL